MYTDLPSLSRMAKLENQLFFKLGLNFPANLPFSTGTTRNSEQIVNQAKHQLFRLTVLQLHGGRQ